MWISISFKTICWKDSPFPTDLPGTIVKSVELINVSLSLDPYVLHQGLVMKHSFVLKYSNMSPPALLGFSKSTLAASFAFAYQF